MEALGLTLIRPEGVTATCTSGKGPLIDDVLATTRFASAITSVQAVKSAPWGPRCGIRVKYRTNLADINVPELVRPPKLEQPFEELKKKTSHA